MQTIKNQIIALGMAGTALLGADASSYSGVNVQERTISVKGELVKVTQDGAVVQATLPWKGENDLKIKYDLQPTPQEILTDKMKKDVIAEQVNGNAFKLDILLKEKPDTNKFCYAVEGYENYDFLYQPPLDEEMNDPTCTPTDCKNRHRPEEIVGSYAVYHKELRHHKIGGTNYETGKVAHIPYPYVWEIGKEHKKQRAEDFTYRDGELCVVVQQDFLDKADYTNGVRIDPTFGYTTVGASIVTLNANEVLGNKGTPSSAGTVTSISAYNYSTSFLGKNYKPGLWLKSDGSIVTNGIAPEQNITHTSAQWTTTNYTTSPSVSASTDYWVGIIAEGSFSISQYYDSDVNNGLYHFGNNYTTPTAVTNNSPTYRTSIYATYTESGGGGNPANDDNFFLVF